MDCKTPLDEAITSVEYDVCPRGDEHGERCDRYKYEFPLEEFCARYWWDQGDFFKEQAQLAISDIERRVAKSKNVGTVDIGLGTDLMRDYFGAESIMSEFIKHFRNHAIEAQEGSPVLDFSHDWMQLSYDEERRKRVVEAKNESSQRCLNAPKNR